MARKKRSFTLLLLFGAVALVVAAYAITVKIEENRNAELIASMSASQEAATTIKTAQVTAFRMATAQNSVAFIKDADTWYWSEDRDFPVDQAAMKTLLGSICIIPAETVITDVTDLDQYGLRDPLGIVSVITEDNTEHTYYLGDRNEFADAYYFLRPDLDKTVVYTIAGNLTAAIDHPVTYWLQKESIPIFNTIFDITVTGPGGSVATLISREDESGEGEQLWFEQQAEALIPLNTEKAAAFIKTLQTVDWQESLAFRPADEVYAEYGLAEDAYLIEVRYADIEDQDTEKVCTLLVSADGHYGMLAGSDRIYSLDSDLLTPWLALGL